MASKVTYKCHRCGTTIHDLICYYCGFDQRIIDKKRSVTSEMVMIANAKKRHYSSFHLGSFIALLIGIAIFLPIIILFILIFLG